MRVIGGKYRGHRLFVPRGLSVRPTADRVREAIFNILGPKVEGRRVLDLFAGTGALGLEALSRGSSEAVFVDRRPEALLTINRNIEALGLKEAARTLKIDLYKGAGLLKNETEPFDLVFLDPPYGKNLIQRALNLIARFNLTSQDVFVVAEHSGKEGLNQADENWHLTEQRIYGQTKVAFFIKKSHK
ncbi:MAG: 16S rRNA (guanine(966)-N(2))-methyltransferase RsmD [Deltaproteobacteria bacterium]|nr:16S rRNA (guanine(966)-N(2))-methyltransferase RsmD [Deltaproteobacteria bacterium]MBW2052788.1 16S rRNA (guanine(966)-N(2))-methyltransferase RsmD [Deltaproteobacteria bacterium]MBW2140424.1 16S rRNA (guanine(966)-N(2))-methyltransferase RsmD [Deltaproteobacteria bacterium]MBW2323807.1 16S rRNA (guanine(966)-N(2))-methyltransferase RsmD [Deltaproteobacteria bacterium]